VVSRTVKVAEHAEKCNTILDAAQRFIITKGYEQMTTQDILEALQMSRGALYHYFASKQALLLALVERIAEQAEELVLPIVAERELAAQDKLLRFFAVVDRHKRADKDLLVAIMRVWYADENAIFRHKLYMARVKRLAPWLAQILAQGVAEGAFTTAYPEQAARMIISLLEDFAYAVADHPLAEDGMPRDFARLAQIGEATVDALERVVGMQHGTLQQFWRDDLPRWQAFFT
jgi:AcrR family transcriptional regulator